MHVHSFAFNFPPSVDKLHIIDLYFGFLKQRSVLVFIFGGFGQNKIVAVFYAHDAIRKRGHCCRNLCGCLSVTCRYCV